MPANLPPMYFEAEKRFRAAKTNPDKITALEDMLAIMPKHKGTDHLKAELRKRIAKLTQSSDKRSATHRASMMIDKVGAAQVAVIGLPNAGKSQLVSSITNASPAVAEYPFTTNTALPGMMEFENIQIQLIDTPPLVLNQVASWLPHIFLRAEALLVVIDSTEDILTQMDTIITQLENMRISILPDKTETEDERPLNIKKALLIANKIDIEGANLYYQELQELYGEKLPIIAISAKTGKNLEGLKLRTYQTLEIIRVYTKSPGKKTDLNDPIILDKGDTLEDAALEVHKDFRAKLKYARLWGSGKHDGVMVKRDHVLQDGDIVELHL